MQKSFSDLESPAKKKLIRGDRFMSMIDNEPPWDKLPGTARQEMRLVGSPFDHLRRQTL
ncbi:hypothetical protein JAB1_29650 [Janthinobacterium sp. MP5059B]|nr:hypothetical protein JAB1_29650 [Janthinobacterium sp. MP5059B]